jgi:diguanylate cyclase (GGDEF)-like protein/PAS domain S-box-containing protein
MSALLVILCAVLLVAVCILTAGWIKTAAALKKSRAAPAYQQETFSEGPVATLVRKPGTAQVLSASPNLSHVLGIAHITLLSPEFCWFSRILPEDRTQVETTFRENISAANRQQWWQHYQIQGDDGQNRWIREFSTISFTPEGSPLHVHSYLFDDSEYMGAKNRLQMLSNIYQQMRECICVTDANSIILDVNPTFEKTTGYSREEVLGETPRLLKSGRHNGEFYRQLWNALTCKGFWQGEIWNRRKNGDIFPELLSISALYDADKTVCHYIAVFTDISLFKEQQWELEHLVHYDLMTGLPNRTLFADRLKVAIAKTKRAQGLLAVAYLDLDGFSSVNSGYGYRVGDDLLKTVAQRLHDTLRTSDTIARMGGDEFALVLCDAGSRADYFNALERILTRLSAPFPLASATVTVSASIGVTFYPEDNNDPDTLLRHADQAMYLAKRMGRNRYQVFPLKEELRLTQQMEYLTRIEYALEKNEFHLQYQPVIDMRKGCVNSMQAILNWHHPTLGTITDHDFLEQLADTGVEQRLGEWIVRTALSDLNHWLDNGPMEIAVGLSPNQLLKPGFVDFLVAQLQSYPAIHPEYVRIDILAPLSGILENLALIAVIQESQHLGLTIALGNFGSGVSSLHALRTLPVNLLKIDKSFVHGMLENPGDFAIIESIVTLAAAFQHQVVAEGIASTAHGSILLAMGCNLVQGDAISPPLISYAIPDWVREWRPDPEWQRIVTAPPDRQKLPFFIMATNMSAWSDRIMSHVLSNGECVFLQKGDEDCNLFNNWLRHIASLYPDAAYQVNIQTLQQMIWRLQAITHILLDAITNKETKKAHDQLDVLVAERDHFLNDLSRFQQSINQ